MAPGSSARVPRSSGFLFGIAIALGLGTVLISNVVGSLMTGARLNLEDQLFVLLFQVLIACVPFLLLALVESKARLPWMLAISLTALLWSYYVFDGVSRRGDGTGANIGLGLIILASPIWISLPCLVIARRLEKRAAGVAEGARVIASMDVKPPGAEANRARAALLAIVIGVITTALSQLSLSIVLQEPLNFEIGLLAYLFQIVLVAIPFLLIAFLGVTAKVPWLVGLALTAALWGYVIYDTYSRLGDGSGVNIGLGWLMLASPVLISAACLFAARRELRR